MKTVAKMEKQRNFGPDGGPTDPLTFALKSLATNCTGGKKSSFRLVARTIVF